MADPWQEGDGVGEPVAGLSDLHVLKEELTIDLSGPGANLGNTIPPTPFIAATILSTFWPRLGSGPPLESWS